MLASSIPWSALCTYHLFSASSEPSELVWPRLTPPGWRTESCDQGQTKFSLVSGEEGWLHTQACVSQFTESRRFPTGLSPTPTQPPIIIDQELDQVPVADMQISVPSR